MFSPEEVALVERLAAQARRSGEGSAGPTLEGLLVKLRALAGEGTGPGPLTLFEEVLPPADRAVLPDTSTRVRRALERQEPIRVRYRANRTGEVTTRRIRPFNIHFYDGQEYVEAFCELRGSDRIFALGNIEEVLDEDDPPPPPGSSPPDRES